MPVPAHPSTRPAYTPQAAFVIHLGQYKQAAPSKCNNKASLSGHCALCKFRRTALAVAKKRAGQNRGFGHAANAAEGDANRKMQQPSYTSGGWVEQKKVILAYFFMCSDAWLIEFAVCNEFSAWTQQTLATQF
jgi:hypothetical protein